MAKIWILYRSLNTLGGKRDWVEFRHDPVSVKMDSPIYIYKRLGDKEMIHSVDARRMVHEPKILADFHADPVVIDSFKHAYHPEVEAPKPVVEEMSLEQKFVYLCEKHELEPDAVEQFKLLMDEIIEQTRRNSHPTA